MKKIIICIIMSCLFLALFSCKTNPAEDELAQPYEEEQAAIAGDETEIIVDTTIEDVENTDADEDEEPIEEKQEEKQEEKPTEDNVQSNLDEQTNSSDKKEITDSQTYNKDWEGDIDYGPEIKVDPQSVHFFINDIFVAEVTEKTVHEACEDFVSVGTSNSIVEICTVKITDTLRSVYTEKGTVIRVARLTNGDKCEPYEVGKSYLMSTILQPYDSKPICVDPGLLSAEILQNGELRANSVSSKEPLESISTINDFINDFVMKMSAESFVISEFYTIIPATEKEELTEQEVIDYLKEAIKIDSDKVLKTPEAAEK